MPLHPLRTLLPRHVRPHIAIRTFSTTPVRSLPSFLDLQARSVSRENGHFAKQSGVNYIEHSPTLQLLRSERDLAEGKTVPEVEKDGILLTKSDNDARRIEIYEAQVTALRQALVEKEGNWQRRFQAERREWEDIEEKSLRLRLMFGVSLVLMALLAADSIALADDVEEHCPGCFSGNTKKELFVVGYLKSGTEAFSRWFNGEKAGTVAKGLGGQTRKHEHLNQQPSATAASKEILKAKQASPEGMPAGWEKMWTPDGREYYANHVEKYTTWLHPTGAMEVKTKPSTTKSNTLANTPADSQPFWERLMWANSRSS